MERSEEAFTFVFESLLVEFFEISLVVLHASNHFFTCWSACFYFNWFVSSSSINRRDGKGRILRFNLFLRTRIILEMTAFLGKRHWLSSFEHPLVHLFQSATMLDELTHFIFLFLKPRLLHLFILWHWVISINLWKWELSLHFCELSLSLWVAGIPLAVD